MCTLFYEISFREILFSFLMYYLFVLGDVCWTYLNLFNLETFQLAICNLVIILMVFVYHRKNLVGLLVIILLKCANFVSAVAFLIKNGFPNEFASTLGKVELILTALYMAVTTVLLVIMCCRLRKSQQGHRPQEEQLIGNSDTNSMNDDRSPVHDNEGASFTTSEINEVTPGQDNATNSASSSNHETPTVSNNEAEFLLIDLSTPPPSPVRKQKVQRTVYFSEIRYVRLFCHAEPVTDHIERE